MTITRGAARAELRVQLNETRARRWGDDSLDAWLYEGCSDIARKTESLQAVAEVPITGGVSTCEFPADMIRAHRVSALDSTGNPVSDLRYRDLYTVNVSAWSSGLTGIPLQYSMWGTPGNVQGTLYPTPAVDGSLVVYYYRLPTRPTLDSDALEVPEGWERLPVLYAEYLARRADRQPEWQEAFQQYSSELGSLFDMTRRHSDQAGSMGLDTSSHLPDWLIYDD